MVYSLRPGFASLSLPMWSMVDLPLDFFPKTCEGYFRTCPKASRPRAPRPVPGGLR